MTTQSCSTRPKKLAPRLSLGFNHRRLGHQILALLSYGLP